MAHVLNITKSSGGTIDLSGTTIHLRQYTPQVSDDGSDIRERLLLDFCSPTASVNYANIRLVNQYLDQAKNHQHTGIYPRVYAQFDPGTSGTVYRSMLKSGKLSFDDGVLQTGQFSNQHLFAELEWVRDPFWEGPLTELPLSTDADEYATGGVTIYNAFDSPNGNYVDIFTDVLGDMPTPPKIIIQNTKSGSDEAKEFFIWHNTTPYYGFNPLLEAEAAAGAGITDTADANASGGTYSSFSWSGTVETQIATWTIDELTLSMAAGGRYAALARWRGAFPYSNAWVRFKILTSNDNVLWSGNLSPVSSTRELAMLDVLRLPPQNITNDAVWQPMKLSMYGYRNAAGTHSFDIDYLQLSPISRDSGWLRLYSLDKGVPYQGTLIYDGIEGETVRADSATAYRITEFTTYGGPLMLIPNHDDRLYFNTCNEGGTALVDQTYTVKMYYRPRRAAL